ncbi:MAG: hypothetical protein JST89_18855 [Cyanobacteria bacterium SZAS-4]|nr:hypothetical protein [Cyanobacteria bacterium SZAS-4]
MKTLTARSLVVGSWIVAGLSMPLSALAASNQISPNTIASSLQAETAQVDNSPSAQVEPTPVQTAKPASKPLQGGVSKLEDLLKATESTDLYKLAVDKLSKGIKLTAEEYRSLGVGCVGMETDRTFFQNIAIISDVYRDSPADRAGLRKGDRLIDDRDNDEAAKEHPEIPRWKVTFGQAGTQSQYILLKHHKKVPITLTRMNIEDIADDNIRHEWEQIISKLGNPEQGEFEGVGTNPLSYKAVGNDPDDSQ